MESKWTLELMREFSESKGRTGLSHPERVYGQVYQGPGGIYFTFRSKYGSSEVRQFNPTTGESMTACSYAHQCPNVQDAVVQAIGQALATTEPILPPEAEGGMEAPEPGDDGGIDTTLWED